MQAILALEDGRLFRGKAFGAVTERVGEVVFNTSLTGYQEIFTDPSYAGQIVVLTNPHIGNYGTSPSDAESARPYIEGLVVREFSPVSSNWRSTEVADEYLERNGVPVIAEIDTRAVVRHLRAHGCLRGVISTAVEDTDALVAKARAHKKMDGTDLASVVTTAMRGMRASRRMRAETNFCRGSMRARRRRCMWSRMTLGSSRIFCGC
jgi:carbamoyl-phosphate synthase small subunit